MTDDKNSSQGASADAATAKQRMATAAIDRGADNDAPRPAELDDPIGRVRSLNGLWRAVPPVASVTLCALALDHLLNLQFFIGYTLLENQFYFLVLAIMLPLVYLLWPAWRGAPRDRVPLYDAAISVMALGICGFFVANAENILERGWEYAAPTHAAVFSVALWFLVVEAARRAGGLVIGIIVGLASLYPLVAGVMPGPIAGHPSSFYDTSIYHAMSSESILGVPLRAFASLVIGFLIFGVALQHTGGGKFFINLAFALLGHVRGGPAKVSIFSSGLMGSMSGSVITNVLTTGVLSIPAMRRVGFSRAYAGGIEACASTGGVLMPPVMGATAFVMASFLGVPYTTIALAAVVPSVLYFLGLFVQIDAYAARNRLEGLPRSELPSIAQTMREGWYFVFVFVLLVYMLIAMQREALAPFYATALLLTINQIMPHHRWQRKQLTHFLASSGKLFAELIAILAGVGLLIGALSVTGLSGTIANDLIYLAGGNTLVLLLMGAVTSFILGIGMTVTAAYIFLAVALAPALINGGGMDPMAVHLFILYWGMLSFITPPVALGAFAAASVAGARPMETGVQAMRLGSIIYFVPFLFVLNPAILLQGDFSESVVVIGQAIIGVVLIAGALQGYLLLIGDLTVARWWQWPIRASVIIAGIAIAVPGGGPVPLSNLELSALAAVLGIPALLLARTFNRKGLTQFSNRLVTSASKPE